MANKLGTWLNAPIKGMPEMKGMFGILGNSAAGMGIGALGSAVGLIGSNLIGGGLESDVGSGITNIGGSIGSAVGMVNPVLGGIISAGSGIIGGLTTAAFGSKLNKENIARINSVNNAMNLLQVDDTNNNSVANAFGSVDFGSSFTRKDVGKDGWFSNKAKNKFNVLTALRAAAINRANATLLNAADNADTIMDLNIMANFAAKGGLLNRRANIFSTGGFLSTQGGDFFTGVTEINAGGTHEENPNGGVLVGVDAEGTPNLVEEGEVIWDSYVFSNRIKVPDKVREKYKLGTAENLTFADAAKYAARESRERPNDPISANGLRDSMLNLQQEQETIREAMLAKEFAKLLKQLPDEQKMQILQGMMQDLGQRMAPEMLGMPQMHGMPMDPSMGIPQDAPIMQAYGGRKANTFAKGSQMTFGYDNKNVDFGKVYSDDGWYKQAVNFVINNWDDERVQNWIKESYVPSINLYNANRPGYTPITADYVTKDRYKQFSLDGKYGAWHRGNGDLDLILDINSKGVFSGGWKPVPVVEEEAIQQLTALPTLPLPKPLNLGEPPLNLGVGKKVLSSSPTDPPLGNSYPTWLQYAQPIGLLGLVISDALGLTNRADTEDMDRAVEAILRSNIYLPITFNTIGDYRRYRPLDRDYLLNKLNAEAGATRRNIMNVSGGNRGSAIAGLLSADYNAQQSIGDIIMKQELANRQHEGEVAEFNRETNKFNANGIFEADRANQAALLSARGLQLNALLEGAKYRSAAKQEAALARGLNIANLFSSLGQLGLEAQNRKDRDMLIRHGVLRGLFPDELKDTIGLDGALNLLIGKGYTKDDAEKLLGIKKKKNK